jgi:hypothetical protein
MHGPFLRIVLYYWGEDFLFGSNAICWGFQNRNLSWASSGVIVALAKENHIKDKVITNNP